MKNIIMVFLLVLILTSPVFAKEIVASDPMSGIASEEQAAVIKYKLLKPITMHRLDMLKAYFAIASNDFRAKHLGDASVVYFLKNDGIEASVTYKSELDNSATYEEMEDLKNDAVSALKDILKDKEWARILPITLNASTEP